MRWCAKVVLQELTGNPPELGWIELARMRDPSGPRYIRDVAIRSSGFAGKTFGAFHDRTGQELWRFNVGGTVSSAPITYLQQGRQRVTVAVGRAILTFE